MIEFPFISKSAEFGGKQYEIYELPLQIRQRVIHFIYISMIRMYQEGFEKSVSIKKEQKGRKRTKNIPGLTFRYPFT